ncbi:hypothetical protein CYMTET_39158 [Cymbomonas tetramitiformis]|uniref:Rubisco LSMT substrate-binding domain-containing protein n=1 Tax=Cymbomonas tetramitiformis TaxID=36881 RepID=A0AAE0CBT1_9CHLO|nr:hypothetical protein CYMTET_41077 [Cymbomonas tetramitiformis]KAK3251508.1 hypothetical protein CYMTET_39158 [Cymbomonas tetramitiformis]|eukprot:gene24665-30012_t
MATIQVVFVQLLVLCGATSSSQQSKYAVLEQWAAFHGADISKVGVAQSSHAGQVLALREAVDPGDLVLSIPFGICLSSDWSKEDISKDSLFATMPSFWRLALRLLYHKLVLGNDTPSGESFFAPYIDALPRKHALPFGYPDQELQRVHGAGVNEAIQSQRDEVARAFEEYLAPLIANHPTIRADVFTLEELQWAAALAWSRSYRSADPNDGSDHFTFVPVLDMANHRARPLPEEQRQRFVVRDVQKQSRFIYAPYALAEGEQYWHDYGVLTNQQLFTHYGFVPREKNPDDSLAIHLNLTAVGASLEAKQLLLKAGVIVDLEQVTVGPFYLYLGGLSPGLMSVHRLALLDGTVELSRAGLVLSGHPVSAANEARVRAALTSTCSTVLGNLPWSVEDEQRLAELEEKKKQRPSEQRQLMMLRLVNSERELLSANIEFFAAFEEEALAQLMAGDRSFQEEL